MLNDKKNPEWLLQQIKQQERAEHRGALKIFFGYAAGVGKTYAMLQAAHELQKQGVDVVAGYVEPHLRPETSALLEGLEVLPVLKTEHKGMEVREFDLDTALTRKPQVILVDELAHTNAPTCRHEKRYQDVEELLQAGIDVYSTINVQHIESLNDTVAAITGITVRERVPDSVFDRAEQVEIVDLEPQNLLNRLQKGQVYREQQAQRAMANFFSTKNLAALREIALRRCADRVNKLGASVGREQQEAYLTEEHILVCISSSPSNPKIIRTAARMAQAFKCQLTGLFVETPDFTAMSEENLQRLHRNIRLAEQLGARIETAHGTDVPFQIAEFARVSGVSKIVIGRSAVKGKLFGQQTLTEELIEHAPQLDIHIIPDSASNVPYRAKKAKQKIFSALDLAKSVGILAGASVIGYAFYHWGFAESNIIIVYVLGVMLISIATTHKIYSLASSLISVLVFNFLFTEPRFSLEAYDKGYPITFLIMFLAAFLTSSLALKLKEHAKQSALVAYRNKILFDVNQSFQQAETREEIMQVAADNLLRLLQKDIVIYPAYNGELGEPKIYYVPNSTEQGNYLSASEKTVALWVFKNNKQAGAGTQTLNNAQCLYLAVRINQKVYGVIGIARGKRPLDISERSMLLSILGECALALENEKNARERENSMVLVQNEKLRANLLRGVSHDLRTPLTSISGNASNLMYNSSSIDEETKHQLYTDIYDDSLWLINLVENILSITRLDANNLKLHIAAELVADVVDEALRHLNRRSVDYKISVEHEDELLLAEMDAKLIVQVLINLVDNAIKYTPAGTAIKLSTRMEQGRAVISVADNGPGIADEMKEHIFDMFYSGANKIADSRRSLGLGLALCKSIVSAHGGKLTVADNHPQGTVFTFTLPIKEVAIHE